MKTSLLNSVLKTSIKTFNRIAIASMIASMCMVQAFADEEIQLAAAIGMPPSSQPVEDTAPRRATGTAGSTSAAGLSTTAMIGIGVGAAVLIGVVSNDSGSSTTSHTP